MDKEALAAEIDGPLPARVNKILDVADAEGWVQNSSTSLVIRLTREDAVPFFARWDMVESSEGKRSWRFRHAWAANHQPLNYNDIITYLKDPSVIYPEPPSEEDELASEYEAWKRDGRQ